MSVKSLARKFGMSLGLAVMLFTTPVSAEMLAAPSGDAILTVSGNITVTNQGETAVLDRAMLEAMPQVSFKTKTIWTEGEIEFTGILLSDLLRKLGIENGTLKATAINDYAVDIPVVDALQEPAIIAYLIDGKPMSVREKGPLWIVYPYDSNKKFQAEVYYSRSIWQLDRLVVE
jgi:hypothetical protein